MAACSLGVDPGGVDESTCNDAPCTSCKEPKQIKPLIVRDVAEISKEVPSVVGTPTQDTKVTVDIKEVNTHYQLSDSTTPDAIGITAEPDIVTEEVIDGKGRFDKYMRAGNIQLGSQYEKGRIKGAEYAAAYIAMTELMMTQSNSFVIEKYKTDILAEKAEHEIAEMKAKALLERNLIIVQVYKTELEAQLIESKLHTETLGQQLLVTQEEELRKDGPSKRSLVEVQRLEVKEKIQLTHTQEKELRKDGPASRAMILNQRAEIIEKTALVKTEEVELRRKGVVERQIGTSNANQSVAQKELINVQKAQLSANGKSKRALENGQNKVTAAQCELYAAQAKGFPDKHTSDIYKTTMNAWAVEFAESANPVVSPVALNGTNISGTIDSAKKSAEGL